MTQDHKAVFALWSAEGQNADLLAKSLLVEVGPRLADAGATGVQVNISDSAVAAAMLRLAAFDEPVDAVVSVWLPTPEAEGVAAVLAQVSGRVEGWFVEEEAPIPPPVVPLGERQPGLANVAFLRRPDELSYDRWLELWKTDHTPVAVETQATFGYVQNRVLGPATPGSSQVDAVVEELFPIEALTDPHAFYGSGGDGDELWRRVTAVLESASRFGADRDVDVVPTSRYRLL